MGETEVREEQGKGELLYTSPECPLWRKRLAQVVFLFIYFCGLGVVLLLVTYFPARPEGSWIIIFFGIFVTIGFSAILALILTQEMVDSHFQIYSNGLSFPVHHQHPFSDCTVFNNTPRTSGPHIGMSMVCWEDIKYFKLQGRWKCISIMLYLKQADQVQLPLKGSQFSVIYRHPYNEKGLESKDALITALKEHGIPEKRELFRGEIPDV